VAFLPPGLSPGLDSSGHAHPCLVAASPRTSQREVRKDKPLSSTCSPHMRGNSLPIRERTRTTLPTRPRRTDSPRSHPADSCAVCHGVAPSCSIFIHFHVSPTSRLATITPWPRASLPRSSANCSSLRSHVEARDERIALLIAQHLEWPYPCRVPCHTSCDRHTDRRRRDDDPDGDRGAHPKIYLEDQFA
jgi:hypothetical protein